MIWSKCLLDLSIILLRDRILWFFAKIRYCPKVGLSWVNKHTKRVFTISEFSPERFTFGFESGLIKTTKKTETCDDVNVVQEMDAEANVLMKMILKYFSYSLLLLSSVWSINIHFRKYTKYLYKCCQDSHKYSQINLVLGIKILSIFM